MCDSKDGQGEGLLSLMLSLILMQGAISGMENTVCIV